MIVFNELTKAYINNDRALQKVSLQIPSSGITVFVGKSGSGKTTLLNIIAGLIKPDKGSVTIDDENITSLSELEMSRYRAGHVGYIFQDYKLIERWSVEKNISLACEIAGKEYSKEDIDTLCRDLDLVDNNGNTLIKKKVCNLSGGQKQRVAIARALIKKPSILLCDEPTGALDETNSKRLMEILEKISKSIPVLIATHDLSIIKEDYGVVKIEEGLIIESKISNTIEYKTETKEKHKSKKRFSSLFNLAFDFIFSKKIMYAIAALLCGASLFAFSLPLIGESASREFSNIQLDTVISKNAEYVRVEADNIMVTWGNDDLDYHYGGFSQEQINAIDKFNGFNYINIYPSLAFAEITASYDNNYNPYQYILNNPIANELQFQSEEDAIKFGFTRDERLSASVDSHFPTGASEVALTDFQADCILKNGFLLQNHREKTTFSKIDDLIGFVINEKNNITITNIYKSPFKTAELERYNSECDSVVDFEKKVSLFDLQRCPVALAEKEDGKNKSSGTILRLDKGVNSVKRLIDSISYQDVDSHNLTNKHNIRIVTPYDNSITYAIGIFNKKVTQVFLYITSFVFCVVALILETYVMFSAFTIRKKDFGAVACLGGSKRYLCGINTIQLILFSLGCFLFGFGGALAFVIGTNLKWGVSALSLSPMTAVCMFLISIFIASIASIKNFVSIIRSNPAELIKEKE